MVKMKRKVFKYNVTYINDYIDVDFTDNHIEQESEITGSFRKSHSVKLSDEMLIENC